MNLFRDWAGAVGAGIFFSFEARVELPIVKHSRIHPCFLFSNCMVCFVQGSTAVVLTCVYRETCIAAGQNPPGLGQDFGGGISATSYTSFSAKGKAKSARSAVCSSVEFIFTCHEL